MDENRVYGYRVYNTSVGIVLADDMYDATRKVVKAYNDHGQKEITENDINVWSLVGNDGWFENNPDVFEVSEW